LSITIVNNREKNREDFEARDRHVFQGVFERSILYYHFLGECTIGNEEKGTIIVE